MWNKTEHPAPEIEELQTEESPASSPLPMAPEDTPEEPKPAVIDAVQETSEDTAVTEDAASVDQADDAFLKQLFDDRNGTSQAAAEEASYPEEKKTSRYPELLQSKKFWSFFAASALVVAIVCLVVFGGRRLADQAVRIVRYSGDNTAFSFDAHNDNKYLSLHNGLVIASVSGMMSFDKHGEETAAVQNPMQLPVLLANDTVAMGYGIGDSTISTLHYRNGVQMQISVPGTLLDAHLSDSSCIAYSSVRPGYKTVLTALNSAGAEIYTWYSSTRFLSQCAVSKDADLLAAIALGQTGTSFETACMLFATDREEPVAELSLGSDLVYELDFVSEDRLCAVGETALHFFRSDGSGHGEYSYDGGELLFYDLQADSFAAIVRNMNQAGSRYQITTVGHDGTELASIAVDAEILDISANGRYLAVLSTDGLTVYDSRLRQCLTEKNVGFATQVCAQKDGAALLIDGSGAYRVS
ncbi:MAG: hypothetical protein E7464_02135 [Ruminococcaceae bacterium]|nr:hypothetical protein [Oscillospiraceae bacterium]